MQKRSMKKRIYPGVWSVTGGAVNAGEKSIDGLYRECKEELGVDLNHEQVELMMSIKRKAHHLSFYMAEEEMEKLHL